ncbi:lanosterol 14 alpha demethylase [Ascobolus immersus RN42]|uniref:Lanosterol 14 alpha demethylase n=1 Tax=Ascobolus immersus RN42 TaxID=1160509 RepID=A0A3N4HDT9_ASCIM|nr:lanosterol 14 alpha demethylase [Ascobolus immersus RN42]
MGVLAGVADQLPPLTPLTFVGYAAAFIVTSVVVNVLQQLLFKDPSKPPVVFHYFPFFGSTVDYGMDPYAFFFKNQKKYGDVFTFILLGNKMTVALGPKGNDFILNGKLSEVNAEEAYTGLTTPVFGEGVVYDVPNHVLMEQKKFIKVGLTVEAFRSYVPLIVEQVTNYFNSHKDFAGKSGSVSLLKVIPEITVFTASRTLQGKEVRDALDGSFADLYHDLDNGFTPVNFMFPWFPFPHNFARDRAHKKIARTYMDLVEKRRANPDSKSENDMIWNLMNKTYKDGRPLTDKEIAHIMIALLMAGQHTSMSTSCWAILHLAEQPDLVEALYQEQKKVFGDNLEPLSYEKLADCTLMNFVIKETLRIHPPLHSIMRKVKSPMRFPDTNIVVPEGHYVLAAPGCSAIDAQYFPNPLKFDPYRWEGRAPEEEGEKVDFGFGVISKGTASPYLPFGAGRHRCVGEQFANVQLGTILATFVREFTLRLPNGQVSVPPPDYNSMIASPTAPAAVEWVRRK